MSHGARVIRTGASSGGAGSTSRAPPPRPELGLLDGGYARSCSAMLKVAQMISLLIGFLCVKNSAWTDYSAYSYFEVVTMCDFIMILIFYFIYLFRVYRVLTCISWPLAEFLHYLIATLLLLVASIMAASKSYNITGLVAGATFGFLATFLCILSIWLSFKVSFVTQSTEHILQKGDQEEERADDCIKMPHRRANNHILLSLCFVCCGSAACGESGSEHSTDDYQTMQAGAITGSKGFSLES